jgi:hypothetical protein
MDQSKFNGEDTWLGDEDLLDFDSEEECDEGVAHVSSQETLCGAEMEVEPSSAPEQSEEPSSRAGGDLSGETQTNVTEPGETQRHEDDGKPKGIFLIFLKGLLRHASVLFQKSRGESQPILPSCTRHRNNDTIRARLVSSSAAYLPFSKPSESAPSADNNRFVYLIWIHFVDMFFCFSAAVDLREVIERAKKQSRQKEILAQDLDRVVEDAKSGRAENKGRKRQRALKVDPSK